MQNRRASVLKIPMKESVVIRRLPLLRTLRDGPNISTRVLAPERNAPGATQKADAKQKRNVPAADSKGLPNVVLGVAERRVADHGIEILTSIQWVDLQEVAGCLAVRINQALRRAVDVESYDVSSNTLECANKRTSTSVRLEDRCQISTRQQPDQGVSQRLWRVLDIAMGVRPSDVRKAAQRGLTHSSSQSGPAGPAALKDASSSRLRRTSGLNGLVRSIMGFDQS